METGFDYVFVTRSLKVRRALIEALGETGGLWPIRKSDSVSANRVYYAPGTSNVIINTAAARMHEVLGPHSGVFAINAVDRVEAAERAKAIFNKHGLTATVHTHAEPEFPDGFLVFVSAPSLKGIVLLYRPFRKDITADMAATLPEVKQWTMDDL